MNNRTEPQKATPKQPASSQVIKKAPISRQTAKPIPSSRKK